MIDRAPEYKKNVTLLKEFGGAKNGLDALALLAVLLQHRAALQGGALSTQKISAMILDATKILISPQRINREIGTLGEDTVAENLLRPSRQKNTPKMLMGHRYRAEKLARTLLKNDPEIKPFLKSAD